MKTSTRRAGFRHGETAPGASRRGAQVTRFRIDASVNDATHAVAPTLGEEARPWHMVPPTRSDVDATEAAYAAWPSSHDLYREARLRRAALLDDVMTAALRSVGAALHKAYARYRQLKAERATYEALHQLDDRSLRDLGFVRDEIRSVAAEVAGRAEHSRRLARPAFPIRPSLFDLLFRD